MSGAPRAPAPQEVEIGPSGLIDANDRACRTRRPLVTTVT
jgi:hypothetical protein